MTWSLAERMRGEPTDRVVAGALARGEIVRTHVLRPTWHFVAPEDLRWMQRLTGARVAARIRPRDRELGLDERKLDRGVGIVRDALARGEPLTRAELGTALAEAGMAVEGPALAHIATHAEVRAIACSGPPRGKRQTYALVDDRRAAGAGAGARGGPRRAGAALLRRPRSGEHRRLLLVVGSDPRRLPTRGGDGRRRPRGRRGRGCDVGQWSAPAASPASGRRPPDPDVRRARRRLQGAAHGVRDPAARWRDGAAGADRRGVRGIVAAHPGARRRDAASHDVRPFTTASGSRPPPSASGASSSSRSAWSLRERDRADALGERIQVDVGEGAVGGGRVGAVDQLVDPETALAVEQARAGDGVHAGEGRLEDLPRGGVGEVADEIEPLPPPLVPDSAVAAVGGAVAVGDEPGAARARGPAPPRRPARLASPGRPAGPRRGRGGAEPRSA